MDFIKIVWFALVIGSASSLYRPPLNRAINIYARDPYAERFTLPPLFRERPRNRFIRCTQIPENPPVPRGQGPIEDEVMGAMRGYLAGMLGSARASNVHLWAPPYTGKKPSTDDFELFHGFMTLEDFITTLGLTRDQAKHFLFDGNPITDAMRPTPVEVKIYYHATMRGERGQHHTISFEIDGIQQFY